MPHHIRRRRGRWHSGGRSCGAGCCSPGRGPLRYTDRQARAVRMRQTGGTAGGAASAAGGGASQATARRAGRRPSTCLLRWMGSSEVEGRTEIFSAGSGREGLGAFRIVLVQTTPSRWRSRPGRKASSGTQTTGPGANDKAVAASPQQRPNSASSSRERFWLMSCGGQIALRHQLPVVVAVVVAVVVVVGQWSAARVGRRAGGQAQTETERRQSSPSVGSTGMDKNTKSDPRQVVLRRV
jgi:hypothetical protein